MVLKITVEFFSILPSKWFYLILYTFVSVCTIITTRVRWTGSLHLLLWKRISHFQQSGEKIYLHTHLNQITSFNVSDFTVFSWEIVHNGIFCTIYKEIILGTENTHHLKHFLLCVLFWCWYNFSVFLLEILPVPMLCAGN